MGQDEGGLPATVRRLREVGRGAALLALVIGATTLLGTACRIEMLTTPFGDRPPISGLAAIAISCAAIAALVDGRSVTRARRGVRGGLGVAAGGLGVAAMADNVLDVWPGVGMPSVPASIALVVLGAALVLVDRTTRGGKRPAEALASAAGFIALLTLLGHAFGAPELYRSASPHETSLPGSVAIGLLSAAILCARPADGIFALLASPTGGGASARRLGLAALVMIPGLGLVVAIAQRLIGFEERTAFSLVVASATTLTIAVIVVTSSDIDRIDRDLARASAAEHRVRTQLEAISHAAEVMSEAVAGLVGPDVTPVLRAIAEQARLVSHAEYAAIGIASPDDPTSFGQVVTAGVPATTLHALEGLAPRATGLLGDVALRGRSVRSSQLLQPDSGRIPASHPPIGALLGVPLVFAGSQLGSLFLANKRGGGEFTEDDQQTVELLAARAASALKAARIHEVEARAHEWLGTVIDRLPEPIVIADAGGRIVAWNRAASEARNPARVLDERNFLDIRLPSGEPVPSAELPLARALARNETTTGVELLLRRHDQRSLPVVASAAPLRDRDGRSRGAVALFYDITALKELERMREEWTGVIAHDLRQPLNGMLLYTDILRRGLAPDAPEVQKTSVLRIRAAGERLNRMIEDLLDATRIEARKLKLELRSIPLAPLIRDIIDRTPELSERAVHLDGDLALPRVAVDPARIEQVMSNLLSNAIKYGDAGAPIEVRIRQEGGELRVSVANEGGEIQPSELARLFTRFYRTPSAEAGPKRGLGLGLYITKGLVEAHGGRIWADSADLRTTFHFTLPLAPSTASA